MVRTRHTVILRMEGATYKDQRENLGAVNKFQPIGSDKTGPSVLQLQGIEFCQQPE